MITISTQVSGDQIGRELAADAEEMSYALLAIADAIQFRDMQEVADCLDAADREEVAAMLTMFIAALEATE